MTIELADPEERIHTPYGWDCADTTPDQAPDRVILLDARHVFGSPTIYPVCETAKTFARIAGTKTLTTATLKEILKLGYTIKYKPLEPIV